MRLRADHLEGRLTVEELEARVAAAQAAVTVGELAALRVDLPEHRARVSAISATMPRIPGRRAFTHRITVEAELPVVLENAMAYLVPALDSVGLHLKQRTADTLSFSNGRDRATLRLQTATSGRTLLIAHGHAPLSVRRAFAQLAD